MYSVISHSFIRLSAHPFPRQLTHLFIDLKNPFEHGDPEAGAKEPRTSTRERGVVEATRLTASLTKKPFLSESGS